MDLPLLGRTNRRFPRVWLRPSASGVGGLDALGEAVVASGLPVDITTAPALWGSFVRSRKSVVVQCSSLDVERATSHDHAADLVQAHLLQTLSCLNRDYVDVYFLRMTRAWEEFALSGALSTVELAKQDGLILHLGLASERNPLAAAANWQFHDGFELILLDPGPDSEPLEAMARERRVGLVYRAAEASELGLASTRSPILVPVRTCKETERAMGIVRALGSPEGVTLES